MGRESFCLQCEHVWHSLKADHCPECGSEDITTDSDFDDGHFEGDLGPGHSNPYEIED